QARPHLAGEPLDHAAGHDETSESSRLLEPDELADRLVTLVLRRLQEAAGVHHQDIGALGIERDVEPAPSELAEHDLAVDEVLRAAEGDETDRDHRGLILPFFAGGVLRRPAGTRRRAEGTRSLTESNSRTRYRRHSRVDRRDDTLLGSPLRRRP